MASKSIKSIGLIIGSTRNPRVGPKISEHILSVLAPLSSHDIEVIDLAEWKLPIFDEPTIPAQVHGPDGYAHKHTQDWSREVSRHSAFIFVTPQYNWSLPAGLKNAIDYLFNEWAGKPALIVSYGTRGGGKGAAALRGVLDGVRMKSLDEMIGYPLNAISGGDEAAQKRGELADGLLEKWKSHDNDLKAAFSQLSDTLEPRPVVS